MLEQDAVFESGSRVLIDQEAMEIESFRRQHGRCIAKFKGIDTISEVERYVGKEIKIAADTLPAVEEGWFYTFQLKGCRVYAADGEYIGEVTDVLDAGGSQILKVDRENEETLIPFAQEYLKSIDLDQRKIVVDLPEGLLDLNK
jgi:16S rRNA processing protein RimM